MSEREAGIGQDREVVFVMDDARVSLRAARDGVVSLHSRIAASLRALDEVESAQRQAAALTMRARWRQEHEKQL